MNARDAAGTSRRSGAAFLLTCLFWSAPAAYSVHAGLPYNPIKLPHADAINARLWAPQGWKFFTRDPQQEAALVYVRDESGRWISAATGTAPAPATLFGVRREGRARGVEAGLLMSKLPDSAWQECKEEPEVCLGGLSAPRALSNPSPRPLLCGAIGVALQKPVPFAWARAPRPVTMPSRVVILEVAC